MPVSKTRPGLRALKNTIKRLPPYKFGWLLSLKWWQLLSVQEQLVIFCSTRAEGIHPYLWDCVRSVSCEYCWLSCLCCFLCLTQPWVLHLYCLPSTFLSLQLAIYGTAIEYEITSVGCLLQHSNLVCLQELYNQLPAVLVPSSAQTIAGKPLPVCSPDIYCVCVVQSLFTPLCSCFWYSWRRAAGIAVIWRGVVLNSLLSVSFPLLLWTPGAFSNLKAKTVGGLLKCPKTLKYLSGSK